MRAMAVRSEYVSRSSYTGAEERLTVGRFCEQHLEARTILVPTSVENPFDLER